MDLLERIGGQARRGLEAVRARGAFGRLPPGPVLHSAVQTAEWLRRPARFLRRTRDRYGSVFTMRLVGNDPFVSFSEPDAVKQVFTGPPDELYAGEANIVLEPILGQNSVLLLDGARHLRQRRLLLPPFHGQRMREYGEAMRAATLRSVATWPRGRAFGVHEHTQRITLDVILETVFGLAGSDGDELKARLSRLLDGLANPLLLLPPYRVDLGPRSPGGRLFRELSEVDALIFAQIRKARQQGRGSSEDVLGMLAEAVDESGEPMSELELRDELMTLLVAGHETTATSLAWALGRLLDSPRDLERLEVELAEQFGGGPIDPDGVRELPFLDAIVKETLRLNPVIPMVGRRLQRPMRFGDVELPAGIVAVPNIYLTHRNPDVWAEPDRFAPERMLGRRPSPYAFFPFGGGVRRCIGMAFALYEMQVVLATILQRVRIRPAPGYRAKLVRRSITFAPSEGMPLIVNDRGHG